ncbi:Rieske (2Fe-2S) protein [Sunxiuqinia rutila]|uniref:Rieske (2Fe-2S) protein n=1 Tax=Sunxiuqinia rutila TaxID=1397841 RepID=UPI003D35BF8A
MNGIKWLSLRFSFFLLLLLLAAPACKDDFKSSIPYVDVSLSINLVNNNGLYIPANPQFFRGGYGGIIVIYTGYSYYAYDAACPYDVEVNYDCRFKESGDIVVVCPCCGTNYNLMEGGYASDGPSAEPLKQYRVIISNNRLHITN